MLMAVPDPASLDDFRKVVVDGMREAINSAASKGWEAQMMAVIVVCMILYFALDKYLTYRREERLGKRLTELETFVQQTLLKVVNDTSAMATTVLDAVKSLTSALNTRPCILDAERQDDVVDRLANGLANRGLAWPAKKQSHDTPE